jgi:signal peptidase
MKAERDKEVNPEMIKSLEQINKEFKSEIYSKESAQQPVLPPGGSERWRTDLSKDLEKPSSASISSKNTPTDFDIPGIRDHSIADMQNDLNETNGIDPNNLTETQNSVEYEPYLPVGFPAPEMFTKIPKPEVKQKKKNSAAKRITDIVLCVLVGFVLVAAIVFNVQSNSRFTIFGYSCFTMITDSMQDEIPMGSLVIVKQVETNNIKIDNNITFIRSDGKTVTHRVINIIDNYENSGARAFKTQGVNNPEPDSDIVYANDIIGVVKFSVPGLGSTLDSVSGNMGIVLLILGGILITIISVSRVLTMRREQKCY